MAAFGSFGNQGGSARFFPRLNFPPPNTLAGAALTQSPRRSNLGGGPALGAFDEFGSREDDETKLRRLLEKMGIDFSSLALKGDDEALAGAELYEPEIDPLLMPPPPTSLTAPPPPASGGNTTRRANVGGRSNVQTSNTYQPRSSIRAPQSPITPSTRSPTRSSTTTRITSKRRR